MKIRIVSRSKQDIPYEHRQYVDSPSEAPEGVDLHEGDEEDTWFYDVRDVEGQNDGWPEEYSPTEWEENRQEFGGFENGDIVNVYIEEENEVYTGELVDVDADERGAYYNIEFEDGSDIWTTLDNMAVVDAVAPEEGERVELEEYETGDQIRYIEFGEMTEGTVSRVEDDSVYVISENGHERVAANSMHRATRVGDSDDAPIRDIAMAADITADREFKISEFRPKLGTAAESFNNEDHARQTVDHIDQIEYQSGRNAWHSGEQKLMFKEDANDSVVAHEYAHAFADSNGFDTDPEGKGINLSARFMASDFLPREFGQRHGDMIEKALEHLDNVRDDFEMTESIRDTLEGDAFDDVVEKEDFKLQKVDDDIESSEEVDRLIEAANDSWEHVVDLASEGNIQSADLRTPKTPYAASNAHEMLAAMHEIAQSTDGNHTHLNTIYVYHPEMLDAYLDLFDPSDDAKEYLNGLSKDPYVEPDDKEIFDGEPFPEVTENED